MERGSEDRRRFIAALIGGQVGALLGLLLFGGILFVPLLTAFLGSAIGPLWLMGRGHVRQALAGYYIRAQLKR